MRPSPAAATPAASPALSMTGVSKWFRTKGQVVHALSQIDLDVAPGEFVSVIGPSGCGKSTLLRVLGGLLEPDRGSVTVEGGSPREARRAKRYGFVPQRPALLPWRSVRDNVSLLTDVNRRAGTSGMDAAQQQSMLEHIGLGPFVDALPRELSGGMQQRVAIARAFALDAPVLLMDEPFSSLDEITRSTMRYLLLEMWREARSTVLFVTHSIPEAVALSDRVVVLGARPGRVVDVIEVGLTRPRHAEIEDTDEFHRVVAAVRATLSAGWET